MGEREGDRQRHESSDLQTEEERGKQTSIERETIRCVDGERREREREREKRERERERERGTQIVG